VSSSFVPPLLLAVPSLFRDRSNTGAFLVEEPLEPQTSGVYGARCAALPAILLAYAGAGRPFLSGPQNENRRPGATARGGDVYTE
jgi:hypothetical protein